MLRLIKTTWFYLLLAGVIYLIFRPLVGNVWYPMHDTTHIARLFLLEKTLYSGQIPATWATLINNGYGYPLFQFYAPLVYYAGLSVKMLIGNYTLALKITLAACAFVAGAGMRHLTRRWGWWASLTAAVAYVLLPYAAVNLYVRGAFAEYAAMAVLPWVFACWAHIEDGDDVRWAVVTAVLFLFSHNLIPLITAPFLLVWTLYGNRRNLRPLATSVLLTLAITAWFWVPMLFERSFVQVDKIARTTDYSLHFVYPWQLWNSTWGFGGSAPGPQDGMSFKIGKVQLVATALALLIAIFRKRKVVMFWVGLAAISAFMTTSYSQFIWKAVPMLPIVQFPWRFLSLVGLGVAVGSAALIYELPNRVRWVGAIIVIAASLWFGLKYFVPQTTFTASDTNFTSTKYLSTVASVVPEYMPAWMSKTPAAPAGPIPTSVTGPGTVTIDRAYYPTWVASLDNEPVTLRPSRAGLITIVVPTGTHTLSVSQSHTMLEWIALAISAVALIWFLTDWQRSSYV